MSDAIPRLEPAWAIGKDDTERRDAEEQKQVAAVAVDDNVPAPMQLDQEDGGEESVPATPTAAGTAATAAERASSPVPTAAATAAGKPAPAAARRQSLASRLAAYEVIDLADSASSDDEDDEADGPAGDERAGAARRAANAGAFSAARPGRVLLPAVERFVLTLPAATAESNNKINSNRVFSGRALRRQHYPHCYPPSPPPEPTELPMASPAAAASSPHSKKNKAAANQSKKKKKKRKADAALDYYDCTDSFIDDSELIDDQHFDDSEDGSDGDAATTDRAARASSKNKAASAGPKALTPQQLQALYEGFSVIAAAHMFDDEEMEERADQERRGGKAAKKQKGSKQQPADGKQPAAPSSFSATAAIAAAAASAASALSSASKKGPRGVLLGGGGAGGAAGGSKLVVPSDALGVDDEARRAALSLTPNLAEVALIASTLRRNNWSCPHCRAAAVASGVAPGPTRGPKCTKCGQKRTEQSYLKAAKLQLAKMRKAAAEADAPMMDDAAAATAAVAGTAAGASTTIVPSSDAAMGAASSASRPSSPLLAAVAEPPAPPPNIGSLSQDWLPCFERVPATPALVRLLEEILAEALSLQTGQPAAASSMAAAATNLQPPPSPSRLTSQTSVNAGASPAADEEQKMSDVAPSSTPADTQAETGGGDVAAAAGGGGDGRSASPTPRARAGLRRKQAQNAPALSLTRGLNKMPEHMDALLTRLGVLLDTLTALPVPPYEPSRRSRDAASEAKQLDAENENIKYKDSVFNRFLNMLTRELVWGRQTIRQRLTVGRLQSEISSYIKQRLEVYQRLRDAVRDDIATQRARAIAEGKDVVQSKEWYSADWARLMRFLLDISMLTDDASEAVEELEAWRGKKSSTTTGGSAAGEDGARHPDPDEIRGWEGVLQSAWNKLDISPEAYEPAHLPLLTCVTESLYANLPLLWQDPAAAAAAADGEGSSASAAPSSSSSSLLMSESVVEAAIDQAERDYAEQQQAEEEARQRAEEAAAAEKAQQEAAAREEAERLLKAADEERAAAAAREREQKRRERKAAKKAEAAAAAAAAAAATGTVPSATPSMQVAPPGIAPMEVADGSAAPSAAKAAAAAGTPLAPSGIPAIVSGAGAAGGAGRPKAELRGEGESRQKKCCGALCAKAAPTEGGLWRPLTDFAPQASCAGGVAMRCRACDRQRKQEKKAAAAAAGPPAKPQPPATPVRSNVFAPLPPLEARWKVPSMTADNAGARASSSAALQSPKPPARSNAAAQIAVAPDTSATPPAGSSAATATATTPRSHEGSVSPPLLQPIAAAPGAAAAAVSAPPPAPSAAAAPAGPLLASWGEDS